MLNNFCFHLYAQKSLSHSHTLTLSLSHTLSLFQSLIQSLSTCWTSFVFIFMLKTHCLLLKIAMVFSPLFLQGTIAIGLLARLRARAKYLTQLFRLDMKLENPQKLTFWPKFFNFDHGNPRKRPKIKEVN